MDDKREEYMDFNFSEDGASLSAENGIEWTQAIRVISPPLRAEINGDVKIVFDAPGMTRAKVLCWLPDASSAPAAPDSDAAQGNPQPQLWERGRDVEVMPPRQLGDNETADFIFHAGDFPNGPTTLRICAANAEKKTRDIFELQLFNTGGFTSNQGVPARHPPAAAGMKLAFADDFNSALSVSKDGCGATYCSHKPKQGDFSGWRFSDPADFPGAHNPFAIIGTFLRIRASKTGSDAEQSGTGLLSSARMDGSGFFAKAPCYFECRFTAQCAPGTWPAFWTLTNMEPGKPGDELDIVEAYGGFGKGNPNHPGYSIVSHFWRQEDPAGAAKKNFSRRVPIAELGNKTRWSHAFHTYAVRVGLEDTVYFFDDIEVLRHPTNGISRDTPHFFLINYAIGGISGWPIDLARYGDASDMYVDYIRVYQGERP